MSEDRIPVIYGMESTNHTYKDLFSTLVFPFGVSLKQILKNIVLFLIISIEDSRLSK